MLKRSVNWITFIYIKKIIQAIAYYKNHIELEPENACAQYDCDLAYLKNN
ncbi:hypothetical protein [Coxiella-like endosymbiont of Rhipicephalus sanguineus]|nr:hypothetical protein [Coxiella-like endosymbiont of Rhipicephalus sanguineus]